jgi:hypothetical protein
LAKGFKIVSLRYLSEECFWVWEEQKSERFSLR